MLVNIPTSELESYLEDLAALPLTKEAATILGLGGISSTQRYILPLVVFLGCAGLIFAAAFWSQIALRPALGFAFTGGGVSALFALAFCNEGTRRRSFHWCLNQEVLRRKGIIPSSGNPIIPLRIGPVGSMD